MWWHPWRLEGHRPWQPGKRHFAKQWFFHKQWWDCSNLGCFFKIHLVKSCQIYAKYPGYPRMPPVFFFFDFFRVVFSNQVKSLGELPPRHCWVGGRSKTNPHSWKTHPYIGSSPKKKQKRTNMVQVLWRKRVFNCWRQYIFQWNMIGRTVEGECLGVEAEASSQWRNPLLRIGNHNFLAVHRGSTRTFFALFTILGYGYVTLLGF